MGTTTWLGFASGNKQTIHMPFLIALVVDFPLGTLKNHLKQPNRFGFGETFLGLPFATPIYFHQP
jgi:hypothetical protein